MTQRVLMLVRVVLVLTATAVFAADPPVAVTTCGQVISGQAGFLTGNLDCTGFGDDALVVIDGSLDLRGFTLTGGDMNGLRCESSCTVFSTPPGGTITGASYDGIDVGTYSVPDTEAVLSDIVVTANGSLPHYQVGAYGPDAGISVSGKAELNDVVVSNVVGDGVVGNVVILNNSQIVNNRGNGFAGGSVVAVDSTISGNGGSGIWSDSAMLDGSLIEYNGANYPYQNGSEGPDGVAALRKLKMSDTTVRYNTNNGVALYYSKAVITGSTIVDNGAAAQKAGIYNSGSRIRMSKSRVERNYDGIKVNKGAKVRVERTLIANNNSGIRAFGRNKLIVSDSDISANARYGVYAIDYTFIATNYVTKFRAKTSHFSHNGIFDISTGQRPKFKYEAGVNDCVRSERNAPGTQQHWGICSLDCTNGVLNPGEVCDTGGESASCDDDCTVPVCGDSNFNEATEEECDDGDTMPGDGCDAVCVVEFCGDGITQFGIGEACDGGAVFTTSCDNDCTAVVCGDGLRNSSAGEQCDDANASNGDGCSSTCKREPNAARVHRDIEARKTTGIGIVGVWRLHLTTGT